MWTVRLILICALAHARLSSAGDSCSGRCDQGLNVSYDCQCNTSCENYGDCCVDYYALCLAAQQSCDGRCSESYNSANPCHCNDRCQEFANCCSDYDSFCNAAESCNGRCSEAYNSANPCHCNDRCQEFGNCCSDYNNLCIVPVDPDTSCTGRCDSPFDGSMSCQCNADCNTHGDCCTDYTAVCPGGGGGGGGSDLSSLAQSLWDNDVNRIEGSDIVFNKQAYLSDYSQRNDLSSSPLIEYVNEAKLTGTWPSYIALLDNYNRFTGTRDTTTVLEESEIESFLDAVFATPVMSLTTTWMMDNGYFANEADFRAYVKNIWFTLYTRSGGTIDSSAFEHTFVGEVKNGKVSGYHNWFTFYRDELAGKTNYYGYTSDNEPNQILMQFNLNEGGVYWKELASIIYGSSPEFELAIFTACFVHNPNALSTFTMNGFTQRVQTWDYTGGYIGSIYFSV